MSDNTMQYWLDELKSLGVNPRKRNTLNNVCEIRALCHAIKRQFFRDYRATYSSNEK